MSMVTCTGHRLAAGLGLVAGVDAIFQVDVIDHDAIGIGHLERHAVGGLAERVDPCLG